MHSKPGRETSGNPACAMVACDSAGTELFALLAWNGLLLPSIEIGALVVTAERLEIPTVLLPDRSVSPSTPPPRV